MWWSERVFVCLLAVILAGCGFQPVTSLTLPDPVKSVYIETSDRYTPFYRALDKELRSQGAILTPGSANADAVIRITQDENGQRLISVSAQNKPTQYEVFYIVSYTILVDGNEAMPPRTLSTRRNYNYDETLVLGKSLEEKSLREALARDLVGRLLRRMSTLENGPA